VGNVAAMSVYQKGGYRVLAAGYNANCLAKLGTEGFTVLRRDF